MIPFLMQHPSIDAVALYWIFSAAVSAMPDPDPKTGPGYLWLYRFLHTIAGNLSTVFASKIPAFAANVSKVLILVVLCGFTLSACHGYSVHPNSINTFDSVMADTLNDTKSALDGARPQLQNGTLPATLKPLFTDLANAYNAADAAYKTWRGLMKANQDPTTALSNLQTNIAAMTKALAAYTAAGGK